MQDFGAEASGTERSVVLSTFHGYLDAIAGRDYPQACAYLSRSVLASMRAYVPPETRAKGCGAILPKLLAPSAAAVAAQQNEGELDRVRVEDRQAFVVYHAPGARLFVLTLIREKGDWRVSILLGSILVPNSSLHTAD